MDISLLKSLFYNTSEAVGVACPEGKHIFQNPAFTKLFGYNLSEFNNVGISGVYCFLAEKDEVFSTIKKGLNFNKTRNMVNKSGQKILVNLRANAIFDNNNNIIGYIGFHSEVPPNLKQKSKLQDLILDNLNIQAWCMVNKRTYGTANRLHADYIGFSKEEISFKSLYDIYPSHVADKLYILYSQGFKSQKPIYSEIALASFPGRDKVIPVVINPIIDLNGNTEQLVCFSANLFDNAEATTLVIDKDLEIRKLYKKLVDSTENELSYLSRELHDNISQRLSILIMKITSCIQNLPEDYAVASKLKLDNIIEESSRLNIEISQLAKAIHPTIIGDFGLKFAIESLAYSFKKFFEIEVTTSISDIPDRISQETQLCIYRIIQEALTNVQKHAIASNVAIYLFVNENNLFTTIWDNGIGFMPNSNKSYNKSLGLLSMRERIYIVNGSISIISHPGQGTRIICRVPLKKIIGI